MQWKIEIRILIVIKQLQIIQILTWNDPLGIYMLLNNQTKQNYEQYVWFLLSFPKLSCLFIYFSFSIR